MARGAGRTRRQRSAQATKASSLRIGGVLLVVAVVVTYFGFTKHIPFTHGFRVRAVFSSANSIRKNSPVRIAGVNVGKVKSIERQPGGDGAIVTMEINDAGLPIHRDATLKIRPRIFLEGNFFVDLSPGTPSSPVVSDGATLPISDTATPVQFDQVLGALQADSRASLQQLLAGYGQALTYQPTAADDRTQDPSVQGRSGAQALNQSLRSSAPAFRDTSVVNAALLGTEPHDLSGLIAGLGRVTRALDRNEATLQGLVTNFNTTMGAFASQSANVRSSIRLLGPTLVTANATLADLNSSFPATRAFAREILPGVRETPATIEASFPWIAQTRGLLGPGELQGVARQLHPSIADLSRVTEQSILLLPQTDLFAKCLTQVILPTGDIKILDGNNTAGNENYKEFWYTMVGLAGEGQNFDANGSYVRFQPGGGDQTVSTGKAGGAGGDALFGNALSKPLGNRPIFPGHRPPYVSNVPCYTQRLPALNDTPTGPADPSKPAAARAAGKP
ncbi:MAG TPA: MlaD family protein [Solirubrobacteraceae bacterium]|jgi:ABC-type transporter Mla subunit MlaD|nr:MlaD family protein [Solirubrobacteraceae bacterium]